LTDETTQNAINGLITSEHLPLDFDLASVLDQIREYIRDLNLENLAKNQRLLYLRTINLQRNMFCTSRGLKAIAESPYSKNISKFNLEEMKLIDDACLYHIADSDNLNFLIEINLRNP
jgi:hypothetical protein